MPRTFSLARLLLAVTAFCLLCGVWANTRDIFDRVLLAVLAAPLMLVIFGLCLFSKQRGLLILNAVVGAAFAFIAMPVLGPSPSSFCCVDSSSDWSFAFPALGALLFGGIFLIAEKLDSRSRKSNATTMP